jgi:hypothetical protein
MGHEKCIHYFGLKTEGKRPFGRPRCRWEAVRIHLREIGWKVLDRMHLAEGRDQW